MLRWRLIGILTLLGFWAASVGFPVANLPEKADEDFPCRGHRCGCLNAEMCRTHCCCQKPAAVRTCCARKAANNCHHERPDEECSRAEAP